MTITTGVAPWLALLLCALVLALITTLYIKLKTQPPRLKVALVIIRTLYTLALLLICLDAAVMIKRDSRSRLMIFKSESLTLDLPVASGGHNRRARVEQVTRNIESSPRLADSFTVEVRDALADISGDPPAAIIFVTDAGARATDEARRLASISPAPLFIVAAVADEDSPDVSVNSIDSDGKADLDIPVIIHATLYGRGMAGRSTLVKLLDEAAVVGSTTVEWRADDESLIAPLVLTPRVAGLHRYKVVAEPLEGEVSSQNNEMSFSLDVARGVRRVLFFEDQPTWEGKFLRRVLESNDSIAVDYVAKVSRAATVARHQTDDAGSLASRLNDFERLARYDAIIAGPTDASSLTRQAARNISDFVERRGGGLILLGGNDFNNSVLAHGSPIAHLSPAVVSLSRRSASVTGEDNESDPPSTVAGTVLMVPTEAGKSHPIFRLTSAGGRVEKLGPLSDDYLRITSLKRGAVALAADGSNDQSDARVMMAAQGYGNGRTLLVAPADLWRLRLAERGENEGAFGALWQSMVLWAAGNAEPPVHLRLATPAIEAGDRVLAHVAVRDGSFNPVSGFSLTAALEFEVSPGGARTTQLPVTVTQSESAPGIYELSAQCNAEGMGDLSLTVQGQATGEELARVAFLVHKDMSDWRQRADAGEKLSEVARATGGALYRTGEAEALESRLLGLSPQRQTSLVTYRLRDSVALAFILPMLMVAEYFLRKRYGID